MKKSSVSIIMCAAIVAISFFLVTSAPIKAQTMAGEKAAHPRIAKAIHAVEDAIVYMREAPHDFGGHKVAAIADCEKALIQLREALKYREVQDRKKMR